MKQFCGVAAFSLLVVVVILAGCQFSAPGSEAIYETTAAEMAVLLPGAVSPLGLSAGNATDVAGMTVVVAGEDIYGVYQDALATVDLTLDGDQVWRGIIPGLPIGPVLTFTVIAHDAADDEIFSGVTVQALTGAGDEVSVTLEPVEAFAAITFPIITQIARAGEMVNGSVGNSVSVDVRGSTDEQLSYVFTSGGGSFTPDSGTVDLPSSGVGTFISGYDAPAAIGEYPQSVRVENSQGNSVTTNFPTIVVHGTTTVGMGVSFAPSVIGLSGQRIGDVVSWEVEVTDDGPSTELAYLWEYDGALVFADPAQNPADLLGYDQTQDGTITLTVSDGDGLSTTVSFGLVAGQFPDTVDAEEAIFDGYEIVGWGLYHSNQTDVPTGTDFVAVAGGLSHSLALKADGSLVGWGSDIEGLGDIPPGNSFVAIAAGAYHNLVLADDGSIEGWGYNVSGQTDVPAGTDFVAISAGGYFSLALKTDGSIVGWGDNIHGQIDVPAGNDFVAISAGTFHGLALTDDGFLVGWGYNISGQTDVPARADFAAIAAGSQHSLALRYDGSIVGWGDNQWGQIDVPTENGYVAIAAGVYHSISLKADGSLTGWGYNDSYDFGQTDVPAGIEFVTVAAGLYHGLALRGWP